jgi:catecholate siderophore receptor
MTGKAHRRKLKQQRRIARRRAERLPAPRSSTPWIVAGAFVATTAIGAPHVHARTPDPLTIDRLAPIERGQSSRRFDIAGGPLGDVLTAFERVTGLRVEVPVEAMKAVYSPGASGLLTTDAALRQMLEGTSISFRFISSQLVALEFRTAAESVDVSGSARRVESPKFTAPLRDIPQTINVIPSRLMEEQGATTLRDALRNVTGITFQAGEGGTPAGDQMTIRGFSARTDMFVDGIRDAGGYARDTFNLEQVEVAKGPSSAISGRGSTGGSINLVSKTPHIAPAYGGTIEVGTADFERSTVDLNQPFSGGAAVRLNAMWTDGGVPRRDVVENQSWAVAPSLALGLRSPTRLMVSYLHLGQDNVPDYGLPWVPAANIALAAYANGRPPVDNSNFYGLVARDVEKIDNNIATAEIAHDIAGGLTLRNVTRYGATRRDSIITPPRFVGNTSTDVRRTDVKSRDQNDRIVANITNLVASVMSGGLQHDIAAGIEIGRETSVNYARAEFGADNPPSPNTDLYNPDPNQRYTGEMRRTGAYTDASATSAAGYAFDTVKLSDAWQLTGGLRWDRFDVDYDSVSTAGVSSPLSRADNMVSWRAGGVYKPGFNGSVYLGYATSFNPSAEGLALTTSTVNLEPERTKTFEAGSKWDALGERVSLNAAVFRTAKTNARTPGINPGDPPTVLSGKQVVSGVELGASGRINRRWTGIVNYSFMVSDIPRSNTPAEIDQSLQFTPQSSFYLWSTFDLWRTLRVGGGAQYMDSVFRNATNTTEVPSYWVLSSLVSYDVNQHLTLRLNGNNLANAEYVDRTSGGHFIPGPGRSLIVSANVRFQR